VARYGSQNILQTKRVALFFPYERNTEQVRMPTPVGPFFWSSPFWPLDDFFWFFLLNLGSTAPNYSRRPLMRSSKAPPNQKNRGAIFTPTHPNPPELASEPAPCYACRGEIERSQTKRPGIRGTQVKSSVRMKKMQESSK
jgi:hypothetical protein